MTERLADKYDTDKLSYLRDYEPYFAPLRDREIKLLELGVFKGGSLLLWRDYFRKGQIAGLDREPCVIEDDTGRIRLYQGGQDDTTLLDRVAAEVAPDGFDVIIDDCSHIGELTRISFWHLFERHLKPGGIYSVEDWGTGYWGDWPDGRRYREPRRSSMTYSIVSALAKSVEALTGRKPAGRWLRRLYMLTYYGQRFRSHDYGMVGFLKQLVDEAAIEDITLSKRGIGSPRSSKIHKIEFMLGHGIITKAQSS